MSLSGFLSLQRAVIDHLTSDSALMAQISGVFDEPHHRTALPFVLVGPLQASDWSAQGLNGKRWRLTIRVFSDKPGDHHLLALADRVHDRLMSVPLAIEGGHVAAFSFESLQTLRDPDGVRQGQLRFSALIQTL
ncbi:hypothetical protein GCM10007972_17530 [Iodidimonas muriae]|uniref:DUF3168 domain-containing protein n=1 Tax=Iodidimonas muriae TaxID=261467 RepID=A0ABQ2LDV9_9PROT|nr:DUF3168 domain-containing protein [Iodidimonas muriae]GER08228.1 hypothetical protein JCM17843_25380 [Kordiimonadales bacterium JCM 17843]GGO12495.1 hypothetical protein GCM10007972_17530 [Iodidimonas muriae]